ncbi:MAG: menaquinone biosynthesis protein [Acidobacteria bacterium]|nr:menaquinone biosynthesis protein [Acidobacteriota bacterium]
MFPQHHKDRAFSLGVVSYLNAIPLIDGLADDPRLALVPDVPSNLLGRLLAGEADLSLCPVIDYQTSPELLVIVPAGGICSDGETLTVRVFSRVPLPEITSIAVDGESHTSVALLQVLFHELYGTTPDLVPIDAPTSSGAPPAVLLIGDKVITCQPPVADYRYQLDLGEAWKELTGLPFVFAVWMAREGTDLGHLPTILSRTLETNLGKVARLATSHARSAGWPRDLAIEYLGTILSYRIGPRERAAIETFWTACSRLGLIPRLRPWRQPPSLSS